MLLCYNHELLIQHSVRCMSRLPVLRYLQLCQPFVNKLVGGDSWPLQLHWLCIAQLQLELFAKKNEEEGEKDKELPEFFKLFQGLFSLLLFMIVLFVIYIAYLVYRSLATPLQKQQAIHQHFI